MKHTGLKKFASVIMTAAILVLPIAAQASLGADRPTKPYNPKAGGFDHVTFNSFTGTPFAGDERNFFKGQSTTNTKESGWADPMTVTANGEYYMQVYIHNGADSSKNTDATKSGIATGTTVKIDLPATTNASPAVATIHADNASPKDITDTLTVKSNGNLNLNYVPGSAMLYSHGSPGGVKLSDSIVNGGVTVGSEKLDGKWLGCFDYMGYVFIKVKTAAPVEKPGLTIAKTVAKGDTVGTTTNAAVVPGDKVSYGITVSNNSKADATNVVVRDAMPAGVTVNSATLAVNGDAAQAITNYQQLFTKDGLNIGTVKAGQKAVIVVHATVNADATGKECSINLLNTAYASATGVAETSSSATVSVSKTCEAPTTPSLPDTGAEGAAAAALGLTAMGTSVQAYLRSKRGLVKAVRNTNR